MATARETCSGRPGRRGASGQTRGGFACGRRRGALLRSMRGAELPGRSGRRRKPRSRGMESARTGGAERLARLCNRHVDSRASCAVSNGEGAADAAGASGLDLTRPTQGRRWPSRSPLPRTWPARPPSRAQASYLDARSVLPTVRHPATTRAGRLRHHVTDSKGFSTRAPSRPRACRRARPARTSTAPVRRRWPRRSAAPPRTARAARHTRRPRTGRGRCCAPD